jgi:cytosine/adenosine deaminase-related metal-dependent hydrolase
LEAAGWPVIYCPRASAYFAAERDFGPHRYREMLAAGITVALGTDSIVNLDTPGHISTWDEMRLLHRRDRADPVTLLKMATINGAAALRREIAPFTLATMGTLAGLVAIPVPNANPNANPSEMLAEALAGATRRDGEIPIPELLAIGRV